MFTACSDYLTAVKYTWFRIQDHLWIYLYYVTCIYVDVLYIFHTNLILPSHGCTSNTPTSCKNSISFDLLYPLTRESSLHQHLLHSTLQRPTSMRCCRSSFSRCNLTCDCAPNFPGVDPALSPPGNVWGGVGWLVKESTFPKRYSLNKTPHNETRGKLQETFWNELYKSVPSTCERYAKFNLKQNIKRVNSIFCSIFFPRSFFSTKKKTSFRGLLTAWLHQLGFELADLRLLAP